VKRLLYILAGIVGVLLLAASLATLAAWWIAWRALPQLDGVARLPELKSEVEVDRDVWGVPRIRAQSVEDMATAQGYVVAQDRLWQMDILRRAAAGELAEIFGPVALPLDRENRVLGLRQAAERAAEEAEPAVRAILDSYARGVNRYIAERRTRLPWEFVALRYEPRPWAAADSFLVGAYMFKMLTTTWEWELARAKVTARVGPELAADLFTVDSPLDHFVEGGTPPERTRRNDRPATVDMGIWESALRLLQSFDETNEAQPGSNNWVVDGGHSYSGKPLLANDMHLQLEVPSIWYIVHLTAPGPSTPLGTRWNVKGFAIPGIPLIIAGHNDRIAWGFTNNGADVQDLFVERFNPENPLEYKANGQWLRAEVRKETIRVRGRADHTLDVVVTRHGPIVRREAGRAYALRWTALEPGGLAFAFPMFGQAQDWTGFLEVARKIPGPAQNIVYADVDGNIGYVVAARVPLRRNGPPSFWRGTMPAPGDTDEYEWTGYIPFDELPRSFNPPEGVIGTANARVVGPSYKWYLTDRWAAPYRTHRIYGLLAQNPSGGLGAGNKLRPEDCIAIQADIVSQFHLDLAGFMTRAAQNVKPKDPRTFELLGKLAGWDGRASVDSVETPFVEYTRRALMRNLLRPHLGDEYARLYRWWRHPTFLENVLRDRPASWLPKGYKDYDTLVITSAEEAVHQMEEASGETSPSQWRWGRFMQLEILHPLGRWVRRGGLQKLLSIGPLEQGGTSYTVKQTGRSIGPSQRSVYDLANWDHSLMNLPVGQSGQFLSPHYRDQFPAWYAGRGLPAPFSEDAVERARKHHLVLAPR